MSDPREDRTALGRILIEMGVIDDKQLNLALEKQENSTLAERLGMVLVHIGYCTPEEIEIALSAQESMRNAKDPEMQKAVMMADYAIRKKQSNGARLSAIQKGAAFRRHSSGQGYQAVTPELLAKGASRR